MENEAQQQMTHSYPNTLCVFFEGKNELDMTAGIQAQIDNHYKKATCINTRFGTQITNDNDFNNFIDQLEENSGKKIEAIEIVVNFHGADDGEIKDAGNLNHYFKLVAENLKNFLQDNKDTKIYLKLEPCHGADKVKVGNQENLVSLHQLLIDTLGEFSNRVVCRSVKEKDHVHITGPHTHTTATHCHRHISGTEAMDKGMELYYDKYGKELKTENGQQKYPTCMSFKSAMRGKKTYCNMRYYMLKEYDKGTSIGKDKKNKFLNRQKQEIKEIDTTSDDFVNKITDYCSARLNYKSVQIKQYKSKLSIGSGDKKATNYHG